MYLLWSIFLLLITTSVLFFNFRVITLISTEVYQLILIRKFILYRYNVRENTKLRRPKACNERIQGFFNR